MLTNSKNVVGLKWKHGLSAAVMALCLVGLGGCTGSEMIAGDVTGALIDKADQAWRTGKFQLFRAVPWERAADDERQAAEALGLKFVREERHPEQIKLVYADDRNQEVVINAIRRNEKLTELRVDVGLFGPEGLGRITMQSIMQEMGEEPYQANERF